MKDISKKEFKIFSWLPVNEELIILQIELSSSILLINAPTALKTFWNQLNQLNEKW